MVHRLDPAGLKSRSTFAYAKIGETTPLRVGAVGLGAIRGFGTCQPTHLGTGLLFSWVDDGR